MNKRLCIIQARYDSIRLPGKMCLDIGGHSVIWHAWTTACEFYGKGNVVVAIPGADVVGPLGAELRNIGAAIFAYSGPEDDVLGRFYECATLWEAKHIVRITPDDFPIDVTRERFTFTQLADWHATVTEPMLREHIGLLIPQRIEINTREDLDKAREQV